MCRLPIFDERSGIMNIQNILIQNGFAPRPRYRRSSTMFDTEKWRIITFMPKGIHSQAIFLASPMAAACRQTHR